MGLLKRIQGLVVINDLPEEDEELHVEPPPEVKEVKVKIRIAARRTCCDKYKCVFLVLLVCLLLGLLIPTILLGTVFAPKDEVLDHRGYCYLNDSVKYRCGGQDETNASCPSLGCCYMKSGGHQPSCYQSQPPEYGFFVRDITSATINKKLSPLKTASLSSDLNGFEASISLKSIRSTTPFGGESWTSNVTVERSGNDTIRLSLFSPGHEEGTFIKDGTFQSTSSDNHMLQYNVSEENEVFNITVYRTDTNEVLFQTMYGPIIIGDDYMEITTTLPTSNIFGLGSRYSSSVSPLFDEYEEWTLNSRDTSFSNRSLPGTHPFFMGVDSAGDAYGVYIRTSAPLQIGAIPAPGLSFRTVIGTLRISIMAGPTPKDVSRQYTRMVGTPYLPPYWALGFHLCRTVRKADQFSVFGNVTKDMDAAGLPYESDCLDARLSYPDSYQPLPDWADSSIQALRNSSRKFLATSYPFVTDGSLAMPNAELDILLKLGGEDGNMTYYGLVSNVTVVYPDYTDEQSYAWMNQTVIVASTLNDSDGLLLLQNSPLNEARVDYSIPSDVNQCARDAPQFCCSRSHFDFQVDLEVAEPSNGTICWSVNHPALSDAKHLAHHNAYGTYHTSRVHHLLANLRPRSRHVLLSAATHPESGALGGHYSEGFSARIEDQKRALLQVLEMGLAGISLTGTPPCGSRDGFDIENNKDEWLNICFRSYQNSLFFPFLLSHYELGQRSTNPTNISPGFAAQLRSYMILRHMMLPTLYTLLVEASDTGAPVLRHLFYEFPKDKRSLIIGDEFMIGSSVLVVPNFVNDTSAGATWGIPAYFPPGRWYELLTGRLVADSSNGTDTTLPTTITELNLFLRGGEIIFMQGHLSAAISHTEDMRRENYTVYAAVGDDEIASGTIYYDDGTTSRDQPTYTATRVTATLNRAAGTLVVAPTDVSGASGRYSPGAHNSTVARVLIFGLAGISNVLVDGVSNDFSVDSETGALRVDTAFDWSTSDSTTITWQ